MAKYFKLTNKKTKAAYIVEEQDVEAAKANGLIKRYNVEPLKEPTSDLTFNKIKDIIKEISVVKQPEIAQEIKTNEPIIQEKKTVKKQTKTNKNDRERSID